jgi:hypothetical protein
MSVSFDTIQRGRHLCWNFDEDHENAFKTRGPDAGSVQLIPGSMVAIALKVWINSPEELDSLDIEQASLSTVPRSTSSETTYEPSPFLDPSNEEHPAPGPATIVLPMRRVHDSPVRRGCVNFKSEALSLDAYKGLWELSMKVTARWLTGPEKTEIRRVFTFDPEAEVGTVKPHED